MISQILRVSVLKIYNFIAIQSSSLRTTFESIDWFHIYYLHRCKCYRNHSLEEIKVGIKKKKKWNWLPFLFLIKVNFFFFSQEFASWIMNSILKCWDVNYLIKLRMNYNCIKRFIMNLFIYLKIDYIYFIKLNCQHFFCTSLIFLYYILLIKLLPRSEFAVMSSVSENAICVNQMFI